MPGSLESVASGARFQLLVESVADYAIFLLDTDGHVASWNRGAERIKGYRASEIIGKHFSIFYTRKDLDEGKPARVLETAARDGRFEELGWRVRKDGGQFWADVTVTALRDPGGQLVGYAKVTRDMTELREVSEALRQSEERMRLMIEAVRDYAIFLLDPTGKIASWNLGAQRLKGYTAAEAIGQHVSIFYSEEDRRRKHPADELERAKAEGRYEEEGWRYRKDGTRFWANVLITAIFDQEGRHIGFTKVTRDFTDARRLREAEVAVQIRDEFISVASHELKTPLSALLMHIASLRRTVAPDGTAPRLTSRLDSALASGWRLDRLIDQMLDVSRITAGRLVLEPELVALDELVREVAERTGERTRIGLGLESRAAGYWDRIRLEQVVGNLVSNALKYGMGKPIQVETRASSSEATIRVVDHGIGIEPEKQPLIFNRFERAVANREFGGFGLGLWISRQIVEAEGGRIAVDSVAGEGSTFTVVLPLKLPEGPHGV